MAVPVVTCGSMITSSWATGSFSASLSATATGGAVDQWEWSILSVPTGLESLYSGSLGNFTNGTAAVQNPTLSGISSSIAAGTIVTRCRAHNSEGWSNPGKDRAGGQQLIVIKSQHADFQIPGDYQYGWGESQLNTTLRKFDSTIGAISTPISASTTTNPITPNNADNTWQDIGGLCSASISVDKPTFVQLFFNGTSFRSGAVHVGYIRFTVDNVSIADPASSVSAAVSTATNISRQDATLLSSGSHVIGVESKYITYGPYAIYDGKLTVLPLK